MPSYEQLRLKHIWLDERFIAKELSKSELDSMTKFAPPYFDYMLSAMSANVRVILYLITQTNF